MMDAQWDSDQEIVINKAGTLLFAVNGHSNNISSFKINADGTLTTVSGSPFPSGGPQPASIGYRDNAFGNGVSLMVVANKDSDPLQTQTAPNYTTFKVSPSGALKMNAGSTFTLPAGSSPSQAMIRNSGPTFLFGIQFAGKNLSSYKLNRLGIMSLISSQTLTNDAVGAVFHPVFKGIDVTLPPASRTTRPSTTPALGRQSIASPRSNSRLSRSRAATRSNRFEPPRKRSPRRSRGPATSNYPARTTGSSTVLRHSRP